MRIAISGLTGSGKTSLAKELGKLLGLFVYVPTFKDIAAELAISLDEYEYAAQQDHSIDLKFDEKVKENFLAHENIVLASWLAIWNVDADLKVFLTAPEEVRARRIAKREGLSFEDALQYLRKRDERNRKRYLEVYGIDIFKPLDVADIALNNSRLSVAEEAHIISCTLDNLKP